MASTTITLQKGAGTPVSLPGPAPDYPGRAEMHQVLGRTMDGTVYVYDHGVSVFPVRVPLTGLSDSEKAALETFFRTEVEGMLYTFTYTDTNGTAFTARFVEDSLEFTKKSKNNWDVSLPLELNSVVG